MDRLATRKDVAAAAGVSRATVSFVLNGTPGQTISAVVRDRVLEAADRLQYRPHPHARALASGRSRVVLVLLPDFPTEFLLRGLLEQASEDLDDAGYTMVTMDARTNSRATPLWETLRPDVVMAIGPVSAVRSAAILERGVPLIAPATSDFTAFDKGALVQFEHLRAQGHRAIGFASTAVRGMEQLNASRLETLRANGFHDGIDIVDAVVTADSAPKAVASWRDSGVTAVAAFNDDVAALVVGAAIRSGVRVPEDLSVIGHDDTPLAQLLLPLLSSVRVDVAKLGHDFAAQAIAAMSGAEVVSLDAHGVVADVVVRESSRELLIRRDHA